MRVLYDEIGVRYSTGRRTDPRIAQAIWTALGSGDDVLNVGAGTGSYEPPDRRVIAVEPSTTMIAQRASGAASVVRAQAEALPFRSQSFAATLAVLTIHHWANVDLGLAECARVARDRVVVLTWDPSSSGFWLVQEYFPELLAVDREIFPAIATVARMLAYVEVRPVPVPANCIDGFLGAYWRRPAAYLDPRVRAAMSSFARVPDSAPGLARLAADLHSGAWERRFGALLGLDELDLGYRLVVGQPGSRAV
jgi:SAM-dependent methyltransferase